MTNLSEQDFWKLDRTFNILFIIVSLAIAPMVNITVFQESPKEPAKLFSLYFLIPMLLLVLLWWCATFFDKISLRIVCWYALFYHVVHAFSTSIYIYVFLAAYEYVSQYIGMWILCAYLIPFMPLVFIYRKYSSIQKPSPKKVLVGIFIFWLITLGLAILAVSGR